MFPPFLQSGDCQNHGLQFFFKLPTGPKLFLKESLGKNLFYQTNIPLLRYQMIGPL